MINEGKDKTLCEIYIKRNNEVIEFLKEGMSWEEIQEKVAHYQDEIDELVYSERELQKKIRQNHSLKLVSG